MTTTTETTAATSTPHPTLTIHAIGTPAPQGSKRAFRNPKTGRINQVESSSKVAPWRQDVQAAAYNAAAEHAWTTPAGPLRVDMTFYLPRPKAHFRTGKHSNELRADAPAYSDKKPDKDKLERATCDALTASGVIRDDAQIATGYIEKRYANPGAPTGATITITPLPSEPTASSTEPDDTEQELF